MCIHKTFDMNLPSVNDMARQVPVDAAFIEMAQRVATDHDLAEKCRTCVPGCGLRFGADVKAVAERVAPQLAKSNLAGFI